MKHSLLLLLYLATAACATSAADRSFRRQFDHFYPDDRRYVTKMYRVAYRKLMAEPTAHDDLGFASTGDRAALHRAARVRR